MTEDQGTINREIREAYDLAGARYDELFHNELDDRPFDRDLLDRFAQYLGPGALVYDMGCGPCAHISRHFRDRQLRVVGIDISERCVAIARERNPGMEFRVMDMTNPGLADASLDGIVAYYSIQHFPKRFMNRLFRGFHRILKPGGKLLVSAKGGEGEEHVEKFMDTPAGIHFSYFSRMEIENYLDAAGFRILFIHVRESYPGEIRVPRIYAIGEKI